MTLEEKAGLMFHAPIFMNEDGNTPRRHEERIAESAPQPLQHLLRTRPRQQAEWHNRLQDAREGDAARHPGDDLDRPAPRLQ